MKHIYNSFMILLLALAVASCDAESSGVFTDDTTEEYQLHDYYIDEYGNEGIVAYINNGGSNSSRKYLIVISLDEELLPWGVTDDNVYQCDSSTYSMINNRTYGVAMHQLMWSRGINRYPAQAWCNKKNCGEEPRGGSWRLPTEEELRFMFLKSEALNKALLKTGGELLDDSHFYWTCVEDYKDFLKSDGQGITDWDDKNRAISISPQRSRNKYIKKRALYVRAVKYIYYHD